MAKATIKPAPAAAPPPARPAIQPRGRFPAWVYKLREYRGLFVPVGFVSLLIVLLVPLPPFLMDVLICGNISLSVIILLTTIYMDQPLDFSVFPSLLLGTTLVR